MSDGPDFDPAAALSEQRGRLSNPAPRRIQRRLSASEIGELVAAYEAGLSVAHVAGRLGVHRHTVTAHLQDQGIERRVNRRKMSPNDVSDAARRYRRGDSLATVALVYGVDPTTVRRELRQFGVRLRARPGWP